MLKKFLLLMPAVIAGLFYLFSCPVLASQDGPEIMYLLMNLDSDNQEERIRGIEALRGTKSKKAVKPLLRIVQAVDLDGFERIQAAYLLGGIGDKSVVEPLITVLEDDMKRRTGVMMGIIPALGMLGDEKAVPILLEALNNRDDQWLARSTAAEALGMIGSKQAVPSLIAAAQKGDTRDAAITALAKISDPRANEVFISALDEPEEPKTRQAAMHGLAKSGESALPLLQKSLMNYSKEYPNLYVRMAVIEVLGQMKNQKAEELLRKTAQNTSPEIKNAALRALSK